MSEWSKTLECSCGEEVDAFPLGALVRHGRECDGEYLISGDTETSSDEDGDRQLTLEDAVD